MKKTLLVLAVVVVLVGGGYFGYQQIQKTTEPAVSMNSSTLPIAQNPNNTIPATQVYTNEKYHFTLRVPKDWVMFYKDEGIYLSNYSFTSQNDLGEITQGMSPATAIKNNAPGLNLSVNASPEIANAWPEVIDQKTANTQESEIKSYLSSSDINESAPGSILKDFAKVTDSSGRIMYLYTRETVDKTGRYTFTGAIWITHGVFYELKNLTTNLPSKDFLQTVAESFIEIK